MLRLVDKKKSNLIDYDLLNSDYEEEHRFLETEGPAIQPEELEEEALKPSLIDYSLLDEELEEEAPIVEPEVEGLVKEPVKRPKTAMFQPYLWPKKREPEEVEPEPSFPTISEAPEKTLSQRILEQITPFKASKVEQTARAQNVVAIAKELGQPIGVVQENYTEAMDAVMKRQGPTTVELIALGIAPRIVFGLSKHAAQTFLGLAKFAGAFEVINLGVSLIKDEDYQFFAGKGASDLLPEEASQLARETVDIAEFFAVGFAAVGASRKAPKLVEKLTKDIFTEFKASKKIQIPADKVADIFRTGEKISPEELDLIKSLNLNGSQYRMAVKRGLDIEVPAEKITTIVDKPYWSRLKDVFGREPAEPIVRAEKAEQTYQIPPAGLLEAEGRPRPRTVEESWMRQMDEKEAAEAAVAEIEPVKAEKPVEPVVAPTEAEKVAEKPPEELVGVKEEVKGEEKAKIEKEPYETGEVVEYREASGEWTGRGKVEGYRGSLEEGEDFQRIDIRPVDSAGNLVEGRLIRGAHPGSVRKATEQTKAKIEKGVKVQEKIKRQNKKAWEEIQKSTTEGIDHRTLGKIYKEQIWSVPLQAHIDNVKKLWLSRREGDAGISAWDKDFTEANFDDLALRVHKKSVEDALASGKPVPAEVLKDYPDLAKEKPAEKPKEVKAKERLIWTPTIGRIIKGEEVSDIGQISAEEKKELNRLVKRGTVLKVEKAGEFPEPKTVYVGLIGREPAEVEKLVKLHRKQAYEEAKKIEKIEAVEPEIEITGKGKEKTVEVPEAEGKELTLKEQKAYLIKEIDTAIKVADLAEEEDLTISSVLPGKVQTVKTNDDTYEKYGTVTIEVPGDGTFTILNTKQSLEHFKKATRGFPAAKWKQIKPGAKPVKVPTPSGKRLTGVEYYNPFRPRKQKIVMAGKDERQFYVKGFYTEGKYLVKVDKKPESKTEYLETDKTLENSVVNITKGVKKAVPAEMVAETFPMRDLDVEDIAEKRYERVQPRIHVVAKNGEHYIYQAHYVDAVLTEHPNSKISILPQKEKDERAVVGTLFFEKGGEVVGVVTPMDPKGEGPPSGKLEDLHKVIQEGYAELTGKAVPKEAKPEVEEFTVEQRAIIGTHVAELGSIKKVEEYYPGKGEPDIFARKRADELFGKEKPAAAKLADTGGYADIGEYKVPPETEGPGPSAMDLPEIVELARQLMQGKLPRIIKRLRAMHGLAAGIFRPAGKGAIELKAGIFKDQLQGAKVLAHEIGHLIDWLPEKTMARGNILGRIASLKKYLKHYLANRPGGAGPITDADRARLRKEARKLAKAESSKLIDEEIRKELPIEPDDILAIWNDATFDLKKNEALYRYIQSLSSEEKKSIVKEALKGEVPRRLKQFAKIVVEKTGRKVEAKPSEKEIYEKYKELVRREIEKRRLFQMDKIMNELIDLTHEWKPFDPLANPNYTKYRYSSPELYADALSALITNPGYLRGKAPHFYEGFFNYLERKPEVKALYEQIQNEIKSGANQRNLVIRTRQGFLKREEELKSLLQRTRNWLTLDALGTWFIDQNFAISRRVNRVGGSNIPENFNPIYRLEEWRHSGTEAEGYLTDFNANVLEPLTKAGLTHIDLGEYLMHWRIATERAEFANPLGWTPERSKQRIKEMDKTFGPILKEVKDAFKNLREDWFLSKIKEAKMYSPELEKTILTSEHYVTFDIIGHLEKSYGRPASGHIYRQIGTFTETGNPLTATVIKDILIMRSINKNIAAKAVVDLFSEHFPKEIKPADTRWNGRFQEIQESATPDTKLMVVMQEGKMKGYYLPKFVAESFRQNPNEANVIARLLRISFVPFRMVFTELNPGFWAFNFFFRDYQAAAKQLPGLKYSTFLKYWFRAIPPSFRNCFGKPDELTKKCLKNKSLLSVASYHWDAPEDLELERLLKRYGITKSYWNAKVLKPVSIFIDGMRNTARAMERVPKLGGYLYLKEKFPQMPEEKVAHLVRARAGSPDFMRTGTGAPFYNYLLPFSNAMKEGTRSAFEAATDNPSEYLWKTMKYNILWKTFVFGGLLGLGGWELKRILEGASDYDLANYNCFPIGLTETGKSVYIRIPQDETGRIIGGTFWMMAKKEYPKAFQSMFDYAAGQVPGLHPMITAAWATTEYMSGRNPFDHFRSRPIINEDVFLAGGKRSHKAFAKWMSNQFGGGIVHRFKHDGIKEIQTDLERFLNQPLASNIVGRFVKVSDYGIRQKVNEEMRQVASMAAEDRLLLNEALVKLLEAKGENITNEEIMAMVKNIDSIPYYTTKALSYKYGNVFMQKLITARSNEQKAVVLRQMIAYMPYAQKISPAQYLDSMVKEIKERIKK